MNLAILANTSYQTLFESSEEVNAIKRSTNLNLDIFYSNAKEKKYSFRVTDKI